MPLNFIVVIDHIYEGPIKCGAFIYEMVVITMQNGPLSLLITTLLLLQTNIEQGNVVAICYL